MSKFILYSTNCPKCKILKQKLDSKNIQYKVIDDAEKMLEIGITSVPVLEIDNEKMNFFESINWINERIES